MKEIEPDNTGGSRNPNGTFKEGVSGNPAGRPKGSGISLKSYWKQKLEGMTDAEKEEFSKTASAEMIWRMAEGNPKQDTDITSGGEKIQPIFNGGSVVHTNESNTSDIQP